MPQNTMLRNVECQDRAAVVLRASGHALNRGETGMYRIARYAIAVVREHVSRADMGPRMICAASSSWSAACRQAVVDCASGSNGERFGSALRTSLGQGAQNCSFRSSLAPSS